MSALSNVGCIPLLVWSVNWSKLDKDIKLFFWIFEVVRSRDSFKLAGKSAHFVKCSFNQSIKSTTSLSQNLHLWRGVDQPHKSIESGSNCCRTSANDGLLQDIFKFLRLRY